MPKHYRELSRRQQRRRLQAYRMNNRHPEIHLVSASLEDQHTSTDEYHTEIRIVERDVGTENSNIESVPSQNNATEDCDTSTSRESVTDRSNDHGSSGQHSSNNNATEDMPLSDWLSRWAIKYNICQNALTPLLQALHRCGHHELPRDARTLLRTPKTSGIQSWSSGSYFHYGLEKALIDQLNHREITFDSNTIVIDLNMDGLPLSKSSKSQLWPILGKIYHEVCDQPFLIGAYHGTKKPPSVSEFLADFIEEYQSLHNDGFDFDNKHYTVTIRCIICDAPARSYVTCTKGHNAYFGCGKCMQEGHWDDHRMLFLDLNSRLRTDANFRNREQEEHHSGYSPFERTSVGMVSQFPIDPLHLMWLGLCKKLLSLVLHGHHTARLSGQQIEELSRRLVQIEKWIPKEFARKPRGLDELQRWKGTEFRLFALYIGPVVLQDILPEANLMYFNTFNCAARILSHPSDCYANNEYARDLLNHFVETCKTLYGEESIIYNMHNLIHIHDDVKKFVPLDNFSAWPFENFMQTLKKMLRKKEKPLCQLYNRLTESSSLIPNKNETKRSSIPVLRNKTKKLLPLNCTDAHERIEFKHFELTNKKPNNCCLLKDDSIVLIDHIGYNNEIPIIIGRKFTDQEALPVYPCISTNLDMYVASGSSDLKMWNITDIKNKTLSLPFRNRWYIIPLLHSGIE